ncbi:hypothetical protein ABZ379_10490 [Streptomyces canus]|uniref:hypothetical protein n=1 Tax=Streptomyces canus TaxID=58343 RepID=UPI0033C69D98
MNEAMTVAHAADALGISRPAVYGMLRSGTLTSSAGPRGQLVSAREVFTIASKRRVDAVQRHPDLVTFAKQIRLTVWPPEPEKVILADGHEEVAIPEEAFEYRAKRRGRDALSWLHTDAVAVFGPAVINTLADLKSLKAAGACAWCWARDLAAVRGGVGPVDHAAVRELIGSPCAKDLEVMRSGKSAVDRLWQAETNETAKRRAAAQQAAQARELEAARADVARAQRRLAAAGGRTHRPEAPTRVTASASVTPSVSEAEAKAHRAREAARYRAQAVKDRAAGDVTSARHLDAVAQRLERM